MKFLITLSVLFFSVFSMLHAQTNSAGIKAKNYSYESNLRSQALVYELEQIMIDSRSYELSEIKGSPYINEDFAIGEVFMGKESMGKLALRYNIYNEYFEIKNNDDTVSTMRNLAGLSIILDNTLYVYHNYEYRNENKTGYFAVLSNGENATLLLKEIRIFKEGIKAQNPYQTTAQPKFYEDQAYFVKFKDSGELIEIGKLTNNEIIDILGNNSNLKKYLKENNLKAKNQDDLAKIVDFYNTLSL